jgi:hypothetical protein
VHSIAGLEGISTSAVYPKTGMSWSETAGLFPGPEGYLSPELYMLALKPSGALFCFLIIGTVKLGCAHQSAVLVDNVDAVVRHGTDPITYRPRMSRSLLWVASMPGAFAMPLFAWFPPVHCSGPVTREIPNVSLQPLAIFECSYCAFGWDEPRLRPLDCLSLRHALQLLRRSTVKT